MKATQRLHDMGRSLWLDSITRGLLTSGTLRHYIQEFSVTGPTSNPTIFDHAIKNSHDYDDVIRQKVREGKSGESLFFELAIEESIFAGAPINVTLLFSRKQYVAAALTAEDMVAGVLKAAEGCRKRSSSHSIA